MVRAGSVLLNRTLSAAERHVYFKDPPCFLNVTQSCEAGQSLLMQTGQKTFLNLLVLFDVLIVQTRRHRDEQPRISTFTDNHIIHDTDKKET